MSSTLSNSSLAPELPQKLRMLLVSTMLRALVLDPLALEVREAALDLRANLQADFNVRVFDTSSSAVLRELERTRSVQKSAESTSI